MSDLNSSQSTAPPSNAPQYSLDDLIYLMDRLRDPEGGCPWDLDQSYASIVPSTIEEAYEVADAIERGDISGLREELGDLMFQVVFYSQLAMEEGRFTLLEVISGLVAKLVRRHPHVFPDGTLLSRVGDGRLGDQAEDAEKTAELNSSGEVKQQWEQIKSGERASKGQNSLMDDVPKGFPALLRAHKLQKRAARVGFDWSEHEGVFDKLQEEIAEIKQALQARQAIEDSGQDKSADAKHKSADAKHKSTDAKHKSTDAKYKSADDQVEEELGDLLFTCVNLVRRLGFDSETALRKASLKFENRFRDMEVQAGTESLESMDSAQLELFWDCAKSNTSAKSNTNG